METLELIVYILIAVVVGGILLRFLLDISTQRTVTKINPIQANNKEPAFSQTKMEFIKGFIKFWQDCGLGKYEKNYVTYIPDMGNLTKQDLMGYITKNNYDETLHEQDLNTSDIMLPALISINCSQNKIFVAKAG
jgi:hypothetical protein